MLYGERMIQICEKLGIDRKTPNADGTVKGVKSVAPTMTLLTNKEGAIIDLEYIKDLNTMGGK